MRVSLMLVIVWVMSAIILYGVGRFNFCWHSWGKRPETEGVYYYLEMVSTVGGLFPFPKDNPTSSLMMSSCGGMVVGTIFAPFFNSESPIAAAVLFWTSAIVFVVVAFVPVWVTYLYQMYSEEEVLIALEEGLKPFVAFLKIIIDFHERQEPFWMIFPIIFRSVAPKALSVWMIIVPGYVLTTSPLAVAYETVGPFVFMYLEFADTRPEIANVYLILACCFAMMILQPGLEQKYNVRYRLCIVICRFSIMMAWLWWNMRYAYTAWDVETTETNILFKFIKKNANVVGHWAYEAHVVFFLFVTFEHRVFLRAHKEVTRRLAAFEEAGITLPETVEGGMIE